MKRKAFTLIETLVVVLILGVVASIAIFQMGGIVDERKDEANKTIVLSVKNTVQNFRMRIDDPTATPAMAALLSNGLVTSDFASEWSIVYSDGQVSNVVAK